MDHLSAAQLEAGLDNVLAAPREEGLLASIVARPGVGERRVVETARLDHTLGLVGDNWLSRGNKRTPDGSAVPGMQVTVMSARVAQLVAAGTQRMALAGDQLYVDLDLSVDNLPAGSRLRIGGAVLEVSEVPHLGCMKFVERFGEEAMRFVNSRLGRQLRLRGVNTFVVAGGDIRIGDAVTPTSALVDS